jgi:hypothetical protein
MKAKDASLGSKILAAIITLAGEIAVGLKWLPGLSALEVIEIAAFIAVLFVTVDLNLLAEKVFHWKPAPTETTTQGLPG